ncbi:MAG: hypothetical protein ACPLPR_07300 [Bacillota bacterium]
MRSQVSQQYLYDIIYELQKAFWDERGMGGRYRLTTVGSDYLMRQVGHRLGPSWKENLKVALEALKSEGIIGSGSCVATAENVLKVGFKDCAHLGVDRRMTQDAGRVFACPCANFVMACIDRALGTTSELAEAKVLESCEPGSCEATILVFGASLPDTGEGGVVA